MDKLTISDDPVINVGWQVYHVKCAVCHGSEGLGDGPMKDVLIAKPADLTKISKRYGGDFPYWEIYEIIDGRNAPLSHGTRDMPVWGEELAKEAAGTSEEDLIRGRINRGIRVSLNTAFLLNDVIIANLQRKVRVQMELPEFDSNSLGKRKQWIKLIDVDEVKQGASRIEYAKKACFVVRDEEAFQVFDSICPHKNVNIPSDAIKGMILVCPMHQWKFSLENGECIEKGNQTPLNKIKHNVEKGSLYLFL